MVFHRGGFGRSFMSTPVAPGWFDNDRFRALSQSNGLPAESIFGMAEDDDGYWWIAIDVESFGRRRAPIKWCHVDVACCLVFRVGLG